MKRSFLAAILMSMILVLGACGEDNEELEIFTDILSDSAFDGYIVRDFGSGAYTVIQGNTQSLFAGIDPGTLNEYRAFIDFPLTGANGVPLNAVIVSAILDIVIDGILPQPLSGTIPVRIDLVSFDPPVLTGTYFDRSILPALASTTIVPPISQADLGMHVQIDVTPLMVEVQRLQLPNFQVRILEDLGPVAPGLIEINDTTGADRAVLAPLLSVTFF